MIAWCSRYGKEVSEDGGNELTQEIMDKLTRIANEAQQIMKIALQADLEEVPESFRTEDEKILELYRNGKKMFEQINRTSELFDLSISAQERNKRLDEQSQELFAYSMMPEIKSNSMKFKIDPYEIEVRVDRKCFVYLSLYIDSHLESTTLLSVASDFSTMLKLLEKFYIWFEINKQPYSEFVKLYENIKSVADTFQPEWVRYYVLKEEKKSALDDLYIAQNDVEEVLDSFRKRTFGLEMYTLIKNKDINGIFAKSAEAFSQQGIDALEKGLNNPEIQTFIEKITNGSDKGMSVQEALATSVAINVQGYTFKTKLLKLQKELSQIEAELNYKAELRNTKIFHYHLLKESLDQNNEEDYFKLILIAQREDKEKIISYLEKQNDNYFRKRNNILATTLFEGWLLFDDEFKNRVAPIVFAELFSSMKELNISPQVKEELEIKLKEQVLMFRDLQPAPAHVLDDAQVLAIQRIADDLYNKNAREIAVIINEFQEEEVPEQLAGLLSSQILEEVGSYLL